MHDMIGSAGMLRGWVAIWTMQLLWSLAMMFVAVGATAVLELLVAGLAHRAQAKALPTACPSDTGRDEHPFA